METETFGDVFICLVKTGFLYQTGHSCGNSVIDSKLDRREREDSFVQIFDIFLTIIAPILLIVSFPIL